MTASGRHPSGPRPMLRSRSSTHVTPPLTALTDSTNFSPFSTTFITTNSQVFKKRQSVYGIINSSTDSLCAVHGRGFCFRSDFGINHNIKAAMKDPIPLMDYTEFDSLPPAIRRKYFSSLERLRYAQQSNAVIKPAPLGHIRNISSSSGRFLNNSKTRARKSADIHRSHSYLKPAKLKKHYRNTSDACTLSQIDAKWFLELPETIRRKHFSHEERILLATQCESIIVDAADETLYRMQQNRRNSCNSGSCLSDTSEVGSLRSFDSDIKNAREEIRNSFRSMEEQGDLDLQLSQLFDPCHYYTSAVKPRQQRSPPLCTKNMRTRSSSWSNLASQGHVSIAGHISLGSHGNVQRTPSILKGNSNTNNNDATHYQDPQARLKLRVYLSSPQKFDEAVEFGFPSQTEENKNPHVTCSKGPNVRKAELVDDIASEPLSDFEDEHWLEISEKVTEHLSFGVNNEVRGHWPDYGPRMCNSASQNSSSSSRCGQILFDHYPHTSPQNREMTLRMTLTRKDLRAGGDNLVSYKKQPCASLENLPLEFASTINRDGNDRDSPSGLRRLWRRVKGRSN